MAGWDHADSRHTAEEAHPNVPPVVAEVMGVDLSAEDGQDERQHRQQVDLAPELGDKSGSGFRFSRKKGQNVQISTKSQRGVAPSAGQVLHFSPSAALKLTASQ